ncbi:hypothetical protein [Streptomyces chilikensis]|uniref:Uncharacterized protein n=1 Tax=Streptomyces chilikensis TaxID=1194079 RepID=A0ABV3EVI2_9ACTN
MPIAPLPPCSTAERVSLVERLSVLPFPVREENTGQNDPGHHLAVLLESRDFWNDRSEETVDTAQREMDAELAAITDSLTRRWGTSRTVDLWPFTGWDACGEAAPPAPQPLLSLAMVAGDMRVWRVPESDRWVGLAVGQADPEWPLQLLAAVGKVSVLPSR